MSNLQILLFLGTFSGLGFAMLAVVVVGATGIVRARHLPVAALVGGVIGFGLTYFAYLTNMGIFK